VALLKADHKQVAEWFEQFESARSDERSSASQSKSVPH
jgi:hypothetical protein